MNGAVLGLNLSHDRAACLVVDGKIRFAIAEERLSRRKYELPLNDRAERYNHLPERAIVYCLDAAGLTLGDVELVVASTTYVLDTTTGRRRPLAGDDVAARLAGLRCPVVVASHHLAHAVSAVAGAGTDHCAVLVVDGGGSIVAEDDAGGVDFERTSLYRYADGQITLLTASYGSRPHYGNSLGDFYQLVTRHVGFRSGEEGKTMALASYSRADDRVPLAEFRRAIHVHDDGRHAVDPNFQYTETGEMPSAYLERFGPRRPRAYACGEAEALLAASAQWALEEAMLALARHAYEACGRPRTLALAGGVALNCVANGRILRETPFEHVFVQPAASDDGTALGDAVLGWQRLHEASRFPRFTQPYLGRSYSAEEIGSALAAQADRLNWTHADDVVSSIVGDLVAGAVVAIFRGGSEFGPRALCHRSILCDPRSVVIRDRLNAVVKHRETFRPFAPVTTTRAVDRFFERGSGDSYMTLAGRVLTPDVVPAITHVDGTARVQTVDEGMEPFVTALLEAFGEATSVPVLLNTSFNDREPICETPGDAIDCFLGTGIDVLYLEDLRVTKGGAS
jgi:carbamoyltransferase